MRSLLFGWCAVVATAMLLGFTAAASAQDDEDWYAALRLGFQPYTVDVEGTAAGRDFETTADLSDIMDQTESIWGFELEVGKGRWFVDVAAFYQEVETAKGSKNLGAEVTGSEFALNPMVGYRAYQNGDLTCDFMAGVYYVRFDVDADIYAPALLGGNRSVEKDLDFVDPMIGARAYYAFNEKVGLAGMGQIGGFGAGSEINAVLQATLVYHINEWLALSAGYRWWHWEYEDDGAILSDLEQSLYGPVVGVQLTY